MASIYYADCIGNARNCIYPHKAEISDSESLKKAVSHDYVSARYKDSYRSNGNFISSDVLVMDSDNDHSDDPESWVTPEDIVTAFPDVGFAVHYSRHHMLEKDGRSARPRFHILFFIDLYTDGRKYAELKRKAAEYFGFFDQNALDSARFLFGTENPEVEFHEGSITLNVFLDKIDDFLLGGDEDVSTVPIKEGSRNRTMSRIAGRIIKRYGDTEKAEVLFQEHAMRCDPPLDQSELETIWGSARKFYEKIRRQPGYVPPEAYKTEMSLRPDDYSDIGQAEVLAALHKEDLVYTDASDFMRYDGIRWVESKQLAVAACMDVTDRQLDDALLKVSETKKTLISSGIDEKLIEEGGKKLKAAIRTEEQDDAFTAYMDAKGYLAFVMKRRDAKYISSALQLARPMLLKNIREFDSNGFLLNTPDGTYDLRHGLRGRHEHTPDDLITKVTAVAPGQDGMELWMDAVAQFFCGDMELIEYVQRIVGLTAIGQIFQEALIIAHGEGRNGKSTFWNSIYRVLGSYSGTISADALTVGCRRNVLPEKAEMKGRRLIIAAELEEGMRLSTSMVKQLCSTDDISAEKKYKDHFEFVPTHTLVLYTNHLPKVGGTDEGIWRRLIVIPFSARIEGDSDIKNYTDFLVTNAGGAILSWIIEGAEKIIRDGYHLKAPGCVINAIDAYRENNDWLSAFIEECCEVGPDYEQKSGEFYQEYRAYCQRNGEYTRSTTDFYTAIENTGYQRKTIRHCRYVLGIRLKSEFLTD